MGLVAIGMVLLGMAIIGGYFLYEFMSEVADSLSGPVKLGIVLLVVGFIMFIGALVRSRMSSSLDGGDDLRRDMEDRGVGEIRSRRDRDEDLIK